MNDEGYGQTVRCKVCHTPGDLPAGAVTAVWSDAERHFMLGAASASEPLTR